MQTLDSHPHRRIPSSASSHNSLSNSVTSTLGSIIPDQPSESAASYLEWVRSWDDHAVATWLEKNKCGTHAHLFQANDIRGNVLLDVDQKALKEMGIQSVGDRIKIVVAVKKLRQACTAASTAQLLASRSQSMKSIASDTSAASESSLLRNRSNSGRLNQRIPPPLHLAGSNGKDSNLPTAYQIKAQSQSALAPPPNQAPSKSPRQGVPPSLPPPKSQPPPIPSQNGRLVNTPSISTTAPQGATGLQHSTSLSRSTKLRPNNIPHQAGTISPARASPHRKAGSLSGLSSFTTAASVFGPRPSTSQGSTTGFYHQQPTIQHPYASNSSPTGDNFVQTNASQTARPSTAGSTKGAHHGLTPGLSPISESSGKTPPSPSPLAVDAPKPTVPAHTSSSSQASGFTVGRGGFARPSTSAGTVSIQPNTLSPAMEDPFRHTIKIVSDESAKRVDVQGIKDAKEILTVILKKFGKLPSGLGPTSAVHRRRASSSGNEDEAYSELDGWAIFSASADGSTKALNDSELVAICTQPHRPERQRGLALRKIHVQPEDFRTKQKTAKLKNFFGEDLPKTSPTSPTYMLDGVSVPATTLEPASPTPASPASPGDPGALMPYTPPRNGRRVSGVPGVSGTTNPNSDDWAAASPSDSKGGNRSPGNSFFGGGQSKIRQFFGHRPPSELVTSHFQDYFPEAEKKKLSKAVRSSIRKSFYKRDSTLGTSAGTSADAGSWAANRASLGHLSHPMLSRFSGSSMGSARQSFDGEPIPPLPSKDQMPISPSPPTSTPSNPLSIPMQARFSVDSVQSAVPPSINEVAASYDDSDAKSIAPSIRQRPPSTRLSVWGGYMPRKKDPETASLLTVDEITAEVENRRLSMASWNSPDGAGTPTLDTILATEEEIEQDLNFDSDEEDDDSTDGGSEAEEEEVDTTFTEIPTEGSISSSEMRKSISSMSTPKKALKWIKGALIGAGSFGQVYLGMNATNGSLMAVKQVELPTGTSHNEERKKSMLSAMEREIELLKMMQHVNIVQYLDSFSDGKHLNIFLEYVPGGSVASLLKNFGPFEEEHVRTFVKQILCGLDYLHSCDIIHRDIKGANVLVDNKGVIKISDFGISKKVEDSLMATARVHRPSLQGSVFWMAPEVVKQTAYTAKADIWSLGCLVVEMFTGEHPWANLTQMQAIFKIGSSATPEIPANISEDANAFLKLTFMMKHEERPSAPELLEHPFLTTEA